MHSIYTKILSIIILSSSLCLASDVKSEAKILEIRFENHRFAPQTLTVPAGEPLQIRVTNASAERIEFESFKLNREKVVDPGQTVIVKLPALRPGDYDFFDDFHADVAEGSIVAK